MAPERDRWRVCALYLLAIAGFFLCVSQHYRWYIMPAYPFLSVFLGAWLSRLFDERPRALTLGAVALVASLAFWLRAGGAEYNPFAKAAVGISMWTPWRRLAALPELDPRLGVLLLGTGAGTGCSSGCARSWERALPRRSSRRSFALLLLGFGRPARRSATGLPGARVRALEDPPGSRGSEGPAGRPIAYPVELPKANHFIVLYYFAEDFDVSMQRKPVGLAPGRHLLGCIAKGTTSDPGRRRRPVHPNAP